jgi:hypothetical protein
MRARSTRRSGATRLRATSRSHWLSGPSRRCSTAPATSTAGGRLRPCWSTSTKIWAEEVRAGGHNPALALDEAFAVAHVFVERSADLDQVRHDAREILGRGGFRILAERVGAVDSAALGATAREEEPHFWQFAGLVPRPPTRIAPCST